MIGDIGNYAWKVYKSCKNSPGSFSNIASEVLSLQAVLKEVEETICAQSLSTDRQRRLDTVVNGCRSVLKDLEKLITHYENLGPQGKRTWDRMKWGAEDIKELRARLTSNTSLLTAWIRCVY
jgi:hypothetical protein